METNMVTEGLSELRRDIKVAQYSFWNMTKLWFRFRNVFIQKNEWCEQVKKNSVDPKNIYHEKWRFLIF